MDHTRLDARKGSKGEPFGTLFVVRRLEAKDVRITGDFTGWSPEGLPLIRAKSGEFRRVLPLEPGRYQYRLLIDGAWSDDPDSERRVPNPYGGENSVLEVPEM